MMSFIFRFVLISFMGMLLDPGQLAHKIPTPQQIHDFEQKVENGDKMRTMIVDRINGVRKDMAVAQASVKALKIAYVDIRRQIEHDAAISSRGKFNDE